MKEEITITDEVIDSLMDDWLDRDGDSQRTGIQVSGTDLRCAGRRDQ